ncbi:MAG TPA: metal-dependent transcriptional regulator [Cyclobacteriaceae bacterium]|nr:metal-dependent transcriptional regulator [Cyclobacteriaceae bacterium]
MLSLTEENYLKAIYHLSHDGTKGVSTSEIAEAMQTRAASVTDMIKKLSSKGLIEYEKYHGVAITRQGKTDALNVIRKHRLWETFLVNKLGFAWGEVHEVAEQLEHIQSPLLIEKLEVFLGHPSYDPHGHPIPDKNGKVKEVKKQPLSNIEKGNQGKVCSVTDSSSSFLQYLDKVGIHIGSVLEVQEKEAFDGSLEVVVDGKRKTSLSKEASENILIGVNN